MNDSLLLIKANLPLILWFIAMIALICVNIGYVYKILLFIKNIFVGIYYSFTSLSRVVATLERHQLILEKIQKELSPNGGKSIRDVINSIRTGVILNDLKLKRLTSGWHVGIFEAEPSQGKCTWVNNTLCNMFGLQFNDMLDFGWLVGIKASERADVAKNWRFSIEKDIPFEWEYTVVNVKNKKEVKCKVTTHPLRDSDGVPLIYYGTVERAEEDHSSHH